MASDSNRQTAQQEVAEVYLEPEYQKQVTARVREKIQEQQTDQSKQKSSETLWEGFLAFHTWTKVYRISRLLLFNF